MRTFDQSGDQERSNNNETKFKLCPYGLWFYIISKLVVKKVTFVFS